MLKQLCVLVLTAIFINGCEFTETGSVCSAGLGIQTTAYTGKNLTSGQLALTFDGGPNGVTAEIGDLLYASGIEGTFFVGGRNITGQESVLTTLKSYSHLVGSRGYSEQSLSVSRDPERELRKTDALILPFVTGDIFLLRDAAAADLPNGVATELNHDGLSRYVGPIGGDVGVPGQATPSDAECWAAGTEVASCASAYLSGINAANHGIVVFHATDSQTVALLRLLLPQLTQLKYSFVRLDTVPEVKLALTAARALPGAAGGAPGCSEY